MADPKLIERVKAAATNEASPPELRQKAVNWLAKNKIPIEAPAAEPVSGFDYANYQVPKTGAEIIGERYVPDSDGMTPQERADEALGKLNDEDPTLPTASKRASLKAPPMYEGREGIGAFSNSPYVYQEPKPEVFINRLSAYREQVPAALRGPIDEAIADIKAHGKESKHYQEHADRTWLDVLGEFKRDGVPVQRVAYAPATGYRTGVNKLASKAASMLYGADQMTTAGLGSALWPTATQDIMSGGYISADGNFPYIHASSLTPEQKKVVERLRQSGILPEEEEMRGQEYDPVLSSVGGIFGLLAGGPKTFGGQAVKAGIKAEAAIQGASKLPAFLRGTTLGSRIARAAAGGAVASGLTGAGQQTVTEGFEAANGGEFSPGDVAERTVDDAAVGGAISGAIPAAGAGLRQLDKVVPAIKSVGEKMQTALRTKPGLGEDLLALEAAGGKTHPLKGAVRSPAGEELAKESLKTTSEGGATFGTSQQQAALKPIADKSLQDLSTRAQTAMQQMHNENQAILRNIGDKAEKPTYLFNELVSTVKNRMDIPFTELSRYREALERISDVKAMLKTDPAVAGRQVMTAAELQKIGMDPEALLKEGFKGNLAGRDVKNIVFTITPKALTPTQLDEATQGLAEYIKWGKDVGSRDAKLRDMYSALVKTRKLFGEAWANLKERHDGVFRELEGDKEALGVQGRDLAEADGLKKQAYSAWQKLAGRDINPEERAALMKTLRDSPELAKRAEAYAGNEAYARLKTGDGATLKLTSGGIGGAFNALTSGSALRFDPVFGFMREMKATAPMARAAAAPDAQTKEMLKRLVLENIATQVTATPKERRR